jgi:hypothetical protein
MTEPISMEATIVAYHREASHMQLEDGARSEDATELKLSSPAEKNGTTLWLYHARPPAADSLWRQIGARIHFSLNTEDLARYAKLYSGAVWDLQRLD